MGETWLTHSNGRFQHAHPHPRIEGVCGRIVWLLLLLLASQTVAARGCVGRYVCARVCVCGSAEVGAGLGWLLGQLASYTDK